MWDRITIVSMERLKVLQIALVLSALVGVAAVGLVATLDVTPTRAQGGGATATPTPTPTPTATPTPTVTDTPSVTAMPTATDTIQPAVGIGVAQSNPGQGEVTVFWDRSDAQAAAWVAYVNLSQWLREATGESVWGDAIQWSAGQWVGLDGTSCQQVTCPQDTAQVSGLTLGDTYAFTVVKSADGVTNFVWPDPVWHASTLAAAQPLVDSVSPSGVCAGPLASLLPQCGGSYDPTPTPNAFPALTPTPTPTRPPNSGGVCDGPLASLLPQCS